MTQEEYFAAPGVSNSALNALQRDINPSSSIIISEGAFSFGKLFECRVQELPALYSKMLIEIGKPGDREKIDAMFRKLCALQFFSTVSQKFATQVAKFNDVTFTYNGITFTLKCKCLFDWWLDSWGGGDLKTFSGNNFLSACKRFQWIESRVFYMLVANTSRDFIIGVSKDKPHRVETLYIIRGDANWVEAYKNVCKKAYDYFILKY